MSAPIPENWGPSPHDSPLNGSATSFGLFTPIEPTFVERPLLQAGTFHLLAAKPETGKGVLSARWLARCSSGAMYDRPRNALWLSSEEDPQRDLRPRLDVAGADVSRVFAVPNEFQLPRDIGWLRDYALNVIGDVGLIVLDPLANHISGTNSNADEEVRLALQPLAILSGEINCPIIGARHVTTKDARGGFVAKILGSTAWVGVPRVVIGAAKDEVGQVHVRVVKGNRVNSDEAGVRFTIEGASYLDWSEQVPMVVAAGESHIDIDKLLESNDRRVSASKSDEARAAIVRILRANNGMLESDTLDALVAEESGVTARTARDLRSELRERGWVRAMPDRDENASITRWLTVLTNAAPSDADMNASRARTRARTHPQEATQAYLAENSPTSDIRIKQETVRGGLPPRVRAREERHDNEAPTAAEPITPSLPGLGIEWKESPPQ